MTPGTPKELDIRLANKDIQQLITDVEKRKLVLPDFQRDFVWPTHQVGKLLESILNGYYINTLLTLPVTQGGEGKVPFPPRKIEGVPDDRDNPFNMEMILDGQQRVTSIYYAMTAPEGIPLSNTKYPQLYCIDLDKAIKGEFDDDAVKWRRRDWESSQQLVDNDFELQLENGLIPFTVFKSKSTFRSWRRGLEEHIQKAETGLDRFSSDQRLTRDEINQIEDNTEVFRDYDVPIVQMEVGTESSKVVQTFERINTQGLELGIFDILTARLYPDNINLRELWKQAISESSELANYTNEEGKTRVRERTLRTLALYRGEECKEENLGKLDSTNFEDDWESATKILERALEKAKSAASGGLGVSDRFGFPYGSIVPPLANLIHIAENEETYPSQQALKRVRQWYWASVFSQRYSGSSDTVSYKDYNTVSEWLIDKNAPKPEAIEEARRLIPVEINLEALTRGGAYNGVMSMLVVNDAKDFGTFESISVHDTDDHHIFPASKLESGEFGESYNSIETNRILNRTIVQYRANRFKYNERDPKDYVEEMIDEHDHGESGVRDVLQSHFINEEGFEALLNNDYEQFCDARKGEIRNEIEERTKLEIDWTLTETEIN